MSPVIGITLDYEQGGQPPVYSKMPWYALRENYSRAVTRAGGLPVLLPHEAEHAADYLDRLDGLIVTGGAFDVDPALFGATSRHENQGGLVKGDIGFALLGCWWEGSCRWPCRRAC